MRAIKNIGAHIHFLWKSIGFFSWGHTDTAHHHFACWLYQGKVDLNYLLFEIFKGTQTRKQQKRWWALEKKKKNEKQEGKTEAAGHVVRQPNFILLLLDVLAYLASLYAGIVPGKNWIYYSHIYRFWIFKLFEIVFRIRELCILHSLTVWIIFAIYCGEWLWWMLLQSIGWIIAEIALFRLIVNCRRVYK